MLDDGVGDVLDHRVVGLLAVGDPRQLAAVERLVGGVKVFVQPLHEDAWLLLELGDGSDRVLNAARDVGQEQPAALEDLGHDLALRRQVDPEGQRLDVRVAGQPLEQLPRLGRHEPLTLAGLVEQVLEQLALVERLDLAAARAPVQHLHVLGVERVDAVCGRAGVLHHLEHERLLRVGRAVHASIGLLLEE